MRNLEPLSSAHPAHPITPLMQVAHEEAHRASTSPEAASADSAPEEPGAKPEADEPQPVEIPAEAAVRVPTASELRGYAPAFARFQVASVLLIVLGMGLAIAPTLSPAAARWLESAGRLHLQPGSLILAGLLLSAATLVRRELWRIRGSLEDVRFETAGIEQITLDGRTLRESLDTVKNANSTLAHDVSNLQVQVKRLTEIVANPDYTVSIFRLAASVDQLGKHIELHMKEQFEGLQERAAVLADQSGHVQKQLVERLDQVQALSEDQHRTQYSAVQEGIAQVLAASEQTNSRIEKNLDTGSRIEARMQDQQGALSLGLDSVLERVEQATGRVCAGIEELGVRVDRQLEGHAGAWQARLTGIDDRLEVARRERSSELQELGGRLAGSLQGHVEELEQRLRTLAELSNANRQELANQLDALGSRQDDHSRNEVAAVDRAREQALEIARTLQRDVAASLAQLEARFGEAAREHAAVLRESSHESQQAADSAQRELLARLEQLGIDLERQGREQQAAIQMAAQEVEQASGTTRRELTTRIEDLGTELERRTRDQLDLVNRAAQESKAATGAARSELSGDVEQLGSRLEAKLDSRTNDLTSDLIELAEMLGSLRSELRTILADSADPQDLDAVGDPTIETGPALEPSGDPSPSDESGGAA